MLFAMPRTPASYEGIQSGVTLLLARIEPSTKWDAKGVVSDGTFFDGFKLLVIKNPDAVFIFGSLSR
jgi:hypothetical protein